MVVFLYTLTTQRSLRILYKIHIDCVSSLHKIFWRFLTVLNTKSKHITVAYRIPLACSLPTFCSHHLPFWLHRTSKHTGPHLQWTCTRCSLPLRCSALFPSYCLSLNFISTSRRPSMTTPSKEAPYRPLLRGTLYFALFAIVIFIQKYLAHLFLPVYFLSPHC